VAAETGFLIDGTIYEIPTLDSLDGDECMVFFDYCGMVQEDFAPLEDESENETNDRNEKQMRHPGFWLALMHIAYRRKHRELADAKVKALIGRTNRLDALSTMGVEEEDDESVPLALTSVPDGSSPNGSPESESSSGPQPVSSGNGSTNGSDPQDAIPAATGALR
jgi:hypothetical protein